MRFYKIIKLFVNSKLILMRNITYQFRIKQYINITKNI